MFIDSAADAILTAILSPTTMIIVVVLGISTLFISRAFRNRETELKLLTNWSLVSAAEKHSIFGTYRVHEAVTNLIRGEPYRTEVLSSRNPSDRLAIEAFLLKTISNGDGDDSGRLRAQVAFEQYGFLAHQCAALLASAHPFDRVMAARILADVQSSLALPFLIEALYDREATVRNQAIVSIGRLRLAAAIGPLLEAACLQQDMPDALVRQSLTSCSFDDDLPGLLEQDAAEMDALPNGQTGALTIS